MALVFQYDSGGFSALLIIVWAAFSDHIVYRLSQNFTKITSKWFDQQSAFPQFFPWISPTGKTSCKKLISHHIITKRWKIIIFDQNIEVYYHTLPKNIYFLKLSLCRLTGFSPVWVVSWSGQIRDRQSLHSNFAQSPILIRRGSYFCP
jgi:hypothetical protein